MSGSVGSLTTAARVPSIANTERPYEKIQHLPEKCASLLLSFLDNPREVARAERVIRAWHKTTSEAVLRGRVEFYRGSWYIQDQHKSDRSFYHRWGNDDPEPFACIRVSSPGVERGVERSWHSNPPKGVQPLPSYLPLRFFINQDGSYKNTGEEVNVRWKGKKLALTCTHSPELCDGTRINNFKEAVAQRISVSLSCKFITEASVQQARTAASVFRGRVGLYGCSWYIYDQLKSDRSFYHRWGNDDPESFACIRVFSPAVERGVERSWHSNPPKGVQPLPSYLPLRLFINRDGSYKNTGDKINIIWKGRKLTLTCTHEPEICDGIRVSDFRGALAKRVEISQSLNFTTQSTTNRAQAAASIVGEWVSSD